MDRFYRTNHVLLGCALLVIAGCGSSESSSDSPPSAGKTSSSMVSGMASDAPPKQLTGGMTLPDEVPLAVPLESPGAKDPNSSKGLQLPDNLTPGS